MIHESCQLPVADKDKVTANAWFLSVKCIILNETIGKHLETDDKVTPYGVESER